MAGRSSTSAEGINIADPVRGRAVRECVGQTGGRFLAIEEAAILQGRDALARRGFYVEPTSAVVWEAYRQLADKLPDPVVLMLTGDGHKSVL